MRFLVATLCLMAAPVAAQEPVQDPAQDLVRDIAAEAMLACGGTEIVLAHPPIPAQERDAAINVLNRRLDDILLFNPGGLLRFRYVTAGEGDTLVVRLPASMVDASAFEGVLARGVFGLHLTLPVDAGGVELPMADGSGDLLAVDPAPILTDADLAEAEAVVDYNNQPAVLFRLTPEGAAIFADTTGDHAGEVFAIVYEDEILSAPRIMERIEGGRGMISGAFTFAEVSELAVILQSGALQVDLTIARSRQVEGDLALDQSICPRMSQ